ncbi:oxidoreductase-like domain-containing protein [Trichonephila clavata]|uniref:Oxidoreductase-like domain-containing protein n=1 Tax=Trichonephila clavata TaxID=2740835 RepID=A0A8X6GAJ2_TRICU|nr:oxidoreductase-like domain-containing protein [Trichonephila clavata]
MGLKKYLMNSSFLLKWRAYFVPEVKLQLNDQNTSTNEFLSNKEFKKSQIDEPVEMPGEDDCCDDSCTNCVWFKYIVDAKYRYKNKEEMLKILNSVPPDKRSFAEMELRKDD